MRNSLPYRTLRRRLKKQRGQASVMLGVMTLTFLFFFAFVVNTGMLVNAKINLQNAADLAAYAGAAVQARQLTQISYLNYEMRRQYKKFLFRYYVLGNMAQCNFPGTQNHAPACHFNTNSGGAGGAGKTPMVWSPDGNPNFDYKVPVVCMSFNSKDDYCQIEKIPEIKQADISPFDNIGQILNSYMTDIGKLQQDNCTYVGLGNVLTLHAWLWNADPDFQVFNSGALDGLASLQNNPQKKDKFKEVFSIVQWLGHGIGLVPAEVMLRQRINTLASYLNTPAQKALQLSTIQKMKQQPVPEPPAYERSIQAFLSAYYTLGNHTFPSESIRMDELMSDQQIKLGENTAKFNAFAIDFDDPDPTHPNTPCIPKATSDSVSKAIPLGVYKDPTILTYYAIALKASAQLMFSPFGPVQLTAYSAAQPFGSRIGPKLESTSWVRQQAPNLNKTAKNPNPLEEFIPNLSIRLGDSTGPGNGWDTLEVMAAMHQAFNSPDGSMPQSLGLPDLERAYHVAMAPNAGEAQHYNIPYDGSDPFTKNFDSSGILSFWAPIFPLTKSSSVQSELQQMVTQYWPGGAEIQETAKEEMIKALSTYIGRLHQDNGEEYDYQNPKTRQGYQIVRLADPVHTRHDLTLPVAGPFTLTGAASGGSGGDLNQLLRTSWDDIRNSTLETGRIGYSVKFISFQSLQNGSLQTSQAKDTMANPLQGDADSERDLPLIKH